ncbi:MAG: DUF4837 family protein [Odoribacter sp.]|nr:DUF4837 family protein [Odoribacter sp.]
MKSQLFVKLMLLALAVSMFSCRESGSRKSMLPMVSGAAHELLVVLPKAQWEGAVGDTIKQYFGQDQVGLPQSEPIFDLLNLPPAAFDKNVKSHRNVLLVRISDKVDSASVVFYESPWARSQKLFKISAPNDEEFYRLFDENKEKMLGVFLKAERDRMVNVYRKTPDTKIFNTFKNKYGLLLSCPGGYVINKDTNDFVWISAETRVDSKGIIFFQEQYVSEGQFSDVVIVDRVNEMLKKYIPGPLNNTWMALDVNTPMTVANYPYEGEHYAVLVKGLWTVVNDFMGGPFVLNVVLDQEANRVIYMMGYVYAPEGKKRNLLRQVESILFSMKMNFRKETQK